MSNENFIVRLDDTTAVIREENIYDSLFKQYERVVLESLITSFGLDFLMGDKHGGDVDTIHNVRQIGSDERMDYKSAVNEKSYSERGKYETKAYHSDQRFSQKKSEARNRYNATGELVSDVYTGEKLEYTKASAVSSDRRVELDHVVECKAIHDDRGRVLAGLNGVDLANDADNLAWTNKSLNASMGAWARHKNEKWKKEHGYDAPLEIVGMEAYLQEHPDIDPETAERMRTQYAKSRKSYENQVAKAYYTSQKFYKDTAKAAGKLSLKMGLRAALGIVFAELWFAARDEVSKIKDYGAELFRAIGRGISKGLENSKKKYKELWAKFLDGAVAGVLSSLVTTLTNIFFTTAKNVVRIIRQTWASLVEAAKIMFFNPDCLRFGERVRATTKVLATGASVVAGVMLTETINKTAFGAIPYVGDIAATFCGTLLTGLMTCSLLYLLDRNETINSFVSYLDKLPTIENYVAYAREQAIRLEEHAAKIYDLSIEQFRKETQAITNAVKRIRPEMDDYTLLSELRLIYSELGFNNPWGNENTFDYFMSSRKGTLTFK
ncbi:MAG: hypothetical protein HDS18_00390 [Bacteroides sp.]|nr:hypothetical protein [Bacteroides sp.]